MVDIAPLNPPCTAAENPRSDLTFEPASRCADSLGVSALCRSEPVAENRGPKYWASWAPSTGPQRMASYFLRRIPSHADLARPGQLLSIRSVGKGHTGFESSKRAHRYSTRREIVPGSSAGTTQRFCYDSARYGDAARFRNLFHALGKRSF
jgi:hypothetical protein